MSNCQLEFIERADNFFLYRCAQCGGFVRSRRPNPSAIARTCQADRSSMVARVRRWHSAVRRWIEAGKPVRDDAEVARLYNEICRPCEHFANGRCRLCGCRVNVGRRARFNKLRMATERCPAEKW